MKKTIYMILALCLVASFAFAQEEAVMDADVNAVVADQPVVDEAMAVDEAVEEAMPTDEGVVVLQGYVLDNMCAQAHQNDLAEFAPTHPKTCALEPDCAASGFSIYADGKLSKFDKESSAKIEEFLKAEGNESKVEVTAKDVNGELSLISITNQL
ncbi:MAG: hypothetical protein WC676_01930 [Candidatus Omnitrophota bacterium]